jgi:purine-nucleoside/S-methyl-5'-thioadenosine phosphorylase / adenosine deaminase
MNSHFTESRWIKPDWPAPAGVFALSTARIGGCSKPPFDSLNLAHHVGDSDAAVSANRAILIRALPVGATVQWLSQVHGDRVIVAGRGGAHPQADACWSREPGRACAVMTADCLPVLFCSVAGDVVAAAHAGWRGLLRGVLENTVAAMGVPPHKLLAWLGPAIGPRVFEVGPEVRSGFLAVAPPSSKASTAACFSPHAANPGHYFADLYTLARLRLQEAGMRQVTGGDFCTFTDAERFFSYRRDGRTGRMASIIMCNPG